MAVPPNSPQPPRTTLRILKSHAAASVKRCWDAIGNAAVLVRSCTITCFNKFIAFFGVPGALSIAALLLAGSALFWAWQHQDLRPLVSAIAGGLGVTLAAVAGFMEKAEKPARWILAVAAGAFTILFAWFTAADLTSQLREKTALTESQAERIRLLSDDVVHFVQSMPPDQYRRALADLGFDKLRARFRNAISKHELPFHSIEFDSSRDIIGVIERMENKNKNGHAIVISGEIAAALDHPSEGVDEFHTYLEVEAETTRDGALGAEVCRNPEGFCRERTAWVFHQLARSLLKIGRRLKATGRPEAEYRQKFSQGLAHACSAIKLFKAHGFTDQVPSTRTVEKALWDELGKGPPQEPQPNTCLAPQT